MVGNKRESVNTLKMVGRMARRRFKGLKMTLVVVMERAKGLHHRLEGMASRLP